jgi:hypothetical protein
MEDPRSIGRPRRFIVPAIATSAAAALALCALAARVPEARAAEGAPAPTTKPAAGAQALSESDRALLEKSQFVYISSTRKDGTLSKPAEIWFMYADGSVWVATPPTSWRAKRIRWGRPMAKIWIGKPSGPSFTAKGELVKDPKRYDEMFAAYAVKYPGQWARWEKSFRDGLASGERVLIRYTPSPS